MSLRPVLESRLHRLHQLEEMMGDPKLAHDHKRFREVNVEYKSVRTLADVARPYLAALDELEQSRELADGDDEEMAALALDDVERL